MSDAISDKRFDIELPIFENSTIACAGYRRTDSEPHLPPLLFTCISQRLEDGAEEELNRDSRKMVSSQTERFSKY